jgi:hypothetical protein
LPYINIGIVSHSCWDNHVTWLDYSQIFMKNKPKPPEGYVTLLIGDVGASDLLWTPETNRWESPSPGEVGSPVTSYHQVIRKASNLYDIKRRIERRIHAKIRNKLNQ